LKEKGIHSKCFDTVQETFVKQALMNEKSTLGAVAMVYLYYQEDDKRKRLEEQGFAALIEQLVLFRKHGNNVALSVDTEILNKLRDDMLTIVKMIGGF
jgi:hypothetical protein